ncbi:MAG TPA: ATP-binding cassette domain-containing protein [Pseudomonadales bacterium]
MSEIVLECRHVRKQYQQGSELLTVLDDVSLQIRRGESVAITGTSGAGKSTLLNLLGGLDSCSAGYVALNGRRYDSLSERAMADLRNRELGFVYQFHHLLGEFSARENTAMPLLIRGLDRRRALQQAADMLARVGLQSRLAHRPAELSGGERQRVAIARALVAGPSCVLMDEPTGNLDEATADTVQQLLVALNNELGTSFVIVTHDRKMAAGQQRVLALHDGVLQEPSPA